VRDTITSDPWGQTAMAQRGLWEVATKPHTLAAPRIAMPSNQ
jgi:hypothetical protein